MKQLLRLAVISAAFLISNWAWALPTLQLDIVGGVYDPTEEDTVATSPTFDLRALLQSALPDASTYYISVAITPRQDATPTPTIGTFNFGGTDYYISDLTYGTPSIPSGLPPHSIFQTYYREFAFTFSGSTVAAYNVQDDSSASGTLYYQDFAVDVSGLLPGYSLHFDLYNNTKFAPFSHDASSGHDVTEGSATLILLGLGLVGMAIARRTSAPKA